MIPNKPVKGPVCQKDEGRIGHCVPGVNRWNNSSFIGVFLEKHRFNQVLTCENSSPQTPPFLTPLLQVQSLPKPLSGAGYDGFRRGADFYVGEFPRPLGMGAKKKMIPNKPVTGPVCQKDEGWIYTWVPGVNRRNNSFFYRFFLEKNVFNQILTC